MLILPVQVIADIWEWKMTNKFFQLYHKLEELEERYNIGIASLLVHEKGFPDQRYAFSLHGVLTIDILINPNYMSEIEAVEEENKKLKAEIQKNKRGFQMNTVKVYLVRKPSDFEEVKNLCKKYMHEAEEGSDRNYSYNFSVIVKSHSQGILQQGQDQGYSNSLAFSYLNSLFP